MIMENNNAEIVPEKTDNIDLESGDDILREVSQIEDEFGVRGESHLFKNFKKTNKFSFGWNNLNFNIGDKQILNNISGHVDGGDIVALMGASGAGKTSLLTVLGGRVKSKGKKKITGDITLNGKKINPKTFRKQIAYVLQQDDLFATATTREALEFSARLRLSGSVSAQERENIVDDLLESLGLTHVANTMVGSELVRGLSGGEKKRVAIGVELVTNPKILFLDEPTSGLDSYSALKLVRILKKLSSTGCAILCTIHQPSAEVFGFFDKLILLARGQTVYRGLISDMPKAFESGGYPIPSKTNPADYMILLCQIKNEELVGKIAYDDDVVVGKIDKITHGSDDDEMFTGGYAANICVQTYELVKREMKNVVRDKTAFLINIAAGTFLNLIFGAIFYQASNPEEPGYTVQGAFGSVIIVVVSAMFGSAQGPLLTFPLERGIMIREYQTGTYSALPYLLSKLCVEIPRDFINAMVTMLVTYWLIGFQGNFFVLVFEVFLVMLSAASLAVLLGAAVSDAKQGQELAPLVLVPQLLFAGFFIPIQSIPAWLRWIQHIVALKYGVNLALITEFGNCSPEFESECQRILDQNEIDSNDVGIYIVILLAIFVLFRLSSLFILVRRASS